MTLQTIETQVGISIHAPRAGGDERGKEKVEKDRKISIHAPRAGGDIHFYKPFFMLLSFQSTPPVRGATPGGEIYCGAADRFQSTPPVRGATRRNNPCAISKRFQSTPPVRGATLP